MRMRNLTGIFMSLLVLTIVGCGGGGGGSSTPSGTNLSGTASKGPIAGGTVKVFEIISSATLNPRANIPRYGTTALAQDGTGADGSYSVYIPTSFTTGSLLIQVTGGSYKDEATGATRNLDDQYGATGMRAVFSNISGLVKRGGALSASVTPFTEMAAADAGSNPRDQDIKNSNQKIALAFNLPDILATRALDPTKPFPNGTSAAEQKYALALASLSHYQKDFGAGQTLAQIGAAMLAEVKASPVGQLPPATVTNIGASSNNFAGSTNNPNSELNTFAVNPSAPVSAAISSDTATAITNGAPVQISVTVLGQNGSPVPVGTGVNFTATPASVVLNAATKTNAAGTATVNISSAVAGPVTITARAGGVTQTRVVLFIVQPTLATLKLITTGTLPAGFGIGAMGGTVTFASDKGLSTRGAVTSGVSTALSYLIANFTNPLQPVVFGFIDMTLDPITQLGGLMQLGEFATVTFDIAPGNPVPTLADFSIAAGYTVSDLATGGPITTVAVTVGSLTLQ